METSRKLMGRHVLLLLVGFFALVIVTGLGFTILAVQSFRGEDIKQSYRQGLDYNTRLAEREAGEALGWAVAYNVTEGGELVVKVSDARGRPIYDISVEGRLRHPTDTARDRALDFTRDGGSLFRADVADAPGQWTLEGVAIRGEDRLRFRRELALSERG